MSKANEKPGKQPAIQFYIGDWMKDSQLSKCTPATRGIWIDAICAMHDSDRSGTLSGTADQLARVLRCSLSELHAAISDLKATGAADVTERNCVVTLVNRRMQGIYKQRLADRERQRKCRSHKNVTPYSSSSSSTSVITEAAEGEIPKALDSPEFAEAWADWKRHRSEIRKPLRPTGERQQLANLEKMGVARAVTALRHSMAQGWTGVFEPSSKTGPPPHAPADEVETREPGVHGHVTVRKNSVSYHI